MQKLNPSSHRRMTKQDYANVLDKLGFARRAILLVTDAIEIRKRFSSHRKGAGPPHPIRKGGSGWGGRVWSTLLDGIRGPVTEHSLASH